MTSAPSSIARISSASASFSTWSTTTSGRTAACIGEFATDYFTRQYDNEWGDALNFDGPDAGPVREYFIGNAAYWIDEFHLDGLRLDATQSIHDSSRRAHRRGDRHDGARGGRGRRDRS